jgi:N-acetylmuramoyl-L-alanine amidase
MKQALVWGRWLFVSAFCFWSVSALAAQIVGVRSWSGEDSTRLVLELDKATDFRVSEDSTPGRIVVLLPGASTTIEGPRWPAQVGALDAMRLDTSGRTPRLILDLRQEAEAKVFALSPNAQYQHRLVVDLMPRNANSNTVIEVLPPAKAKAETKAAVRTEPKTLEKPSRGLASLFKSSGRKIVVSIDPGHGGEDPGAIGSMGTYEKRVTLAISRELASYLNSQDGIQAELTRDGDFYIPLQQRRKIGREQHRADIFVSIHADSAPNRKAHGASVFALSLKGANSATSRFAQQLAEQENKSDLIGGAVAVSDDISGVLAGMLIEGTLKHSLEMGRMILGEMQPLVGKLHSPRVEQAGFAVLKEPGMVSLLVETGFISNPDEEQRLADSDYQRELAVKIGNGILNFCRQYPVPGTYFDQN